MSVIDLSRLPEPAVLEELTFEQIFDAMRQDLINLAPELTDTLSRESEPAVKLLQVCAYRELLVRQRVNEAARAVMPAYARGSDLEAITARHHVYRQLIEPGDPTANPPVPPVYESDAELLRRWLLSLDGYSTAGPARAYVYHALSADPRVLDASAASPRFSHAELDPALAAQLPPGVIVLQCDDAAGLENPMPGDVAIRVLARSGDGTAPADLVAAVADQLSADTIRPLTDRVRAASAEIVPFTVDATLYFYPGPDRGIVRAEAAARLDELLAASRRMGRTVTRSALIAALHVTGVQRVELHSPSTDVAVNTQQAAYATAVSVIDGGVHG